MPVLTGACATRVRVGPPPPPYPPHSTCPGSSWRPCKKRASRRRTLTSSASRRVRAWARRCSRAPSVPARCRCCGASQSWASTTVSDVRPRAPQAAPESHSTCVCAWGKWVRRAVPVPLCAADIEMGRVVTGCVNPVVLYVSGGNTQVISYSAGRCVAVVLRCRRHPLRTAPWCAQVPHLR